MTGGIPSPTSVDLVNCVSGSWVNQYACRLMSTGMVGRMVSRTDRWAAKVDVVLQGDDSCYSLQECGEMLDAVKVFVKMYRSYEPMTRGWRWICIAIGRRLNAMQEEY